MLDSRLKICAECVSGKGIACDVGTDHAYLAAELILSGKCSRVIASDIGEKPLEAARNTVEKYDIEDKVDLILSDGLEKIYNKDITDVVIAGMGAKTIIHIIEGVEWLKNGVRLILQPMTKSPVLRKWLYANGYKIAEERAVRDGKFIYTVITAIYCEKKIRLSEFASVTGHLDFSLDISKEYVNYQKEKTEKIAEGLKKSGDISGSRKMSELKDILFFIGDGKNVSGEKIYNILDELYPFNTQEKWDNSGYLTGNRSKTVFKILLSLDITKNAVSEAKEKNCDMIISHHPVIFEPLKIINEDSVVFHLIQNNISAVCMHTNLDIAEDGTNGVIVDKLSEKLEIKSCEPFDEIGKIINLEKPVSSSELANILKEIFGCTVVKYCCDKEIINKIAVCSGSGGSMLSTALEKECDAFVTGDIKHDVWISANNNNLTLFDCGHFHTENLVLEHLKDVLEANFPFIETVIAESSCDPVKYIV